MILNYSDLKNLDFNTRVFVVTHNAVTPFAAGLLKNIATNDMILFVDAGEAAKKLDELFKENRKNGKSND